MIFKRGNYDSILDHTKSFSFDIVKDGFGKTVSWFEANLLKPTRIIARKYFIKLFPKESNCSIFNQWGIFLQNKCYLPTLSWNPFHHKLSKSRVLLPNRRHENQEPTLQNFKGAPEWQIFATICPKTFSKICLYFFHIVYLNVCQ